MQQDFIYAALLYPDGSPSGELSVGNRDGSTITFLFQKPAGEVTENLTVKVLVFARGTAAADFTEDVALLSGLKSGLKAEGGSITVDAITLMPNLASDAPKGEVSLKVKVPDGYTLEIDGAEHGADQFIVDPSVDYYTIKQKDEAGISGGTYKLTFKVTKDGAVVYAFTDSINVWPGMCTDTWLGLPSGELGADGAREITQAMLAATVFVRGSGGWYDGSPYKDSAVASNDNPGSFLKPFATIQKAIDAVIAANDGASKYTIFVDGTLAYDGTAAQMANIGGANDRNLSLNIKALSDKATLDAKQSGRVMSINAAFAGRRYDIALENLVIMGGKHDNAGGGIYLNGSLNSLTLINCDVKGNAAVNNGGGIFVSRGSILTMNGGTVGGSADADSNKAANGAGVYVASNGSLTMNAGAGINKNTATGNGGGVFVEQDGIVAVHDGTISYNAAASGAGIHSDGGTVAVNGSAKVINNSGTGICATGTAGGSAGTTLTMEAGAVVGGNNATSDGGGILVNNGSIFTMRGGTIGGITDSDRNTATARGGGVYVGRNGTFIMEGGDIIGNIATASGGGVYVTADSQGKGIFEMKGGTIGGSAAGGNAANSGGGVYVVGTFTLSGDTTISGNEATSGGGGVYVSVNGAEKGVFTIGGNAVISGNKTNSYGGGVWVDGMFTMNGGAISKNNAVAGAGGVYVANNGGFTMTDGTISGNSTDGDGGGVYVESSGTFSMNGGIVGDGNKTGDAGKGGGVFVSDGDFTMSNTAAVKGNEAKYGGGIYILEGSTFAMNGGEISENHTTASGGGIYISSGVANMYGGNIFKNEAGTDGGGIYIVSDRGEFTMTDGTISDNTAYRGGGFCNYGATFIMKGDAKVSGNHIMGGEGTGAYITDLNSTGVLKMSGSAQFGADDEVYLRNENNAIRIADILTGTGTVATIEPRDYVVGRQVLSGPTAYLSSPICARFKVKSNADMQYSIEWKMLLSPVGSAAGVLKVN